MKKIQFLFILLVILTAIPSVLVLRNGTFPFWYDPARDLISALANHQKFTLIGPPSGIPSVYYGPYWIWLLSLVTLISLHPAVIIFLTLTLSYFIFGPLILWRLRKTLGLKTIFLFWPAFALYYEKYFTQLWNPHPAPLLFLAAIFFVSTGSPLSAGLFAALLANFHMSFGVGVILATTIFFWKKWRYYVGLVIPFLPTLIFETRHGFNQTKALFEAFVWHSYTDPIVLALKGQGLTPSQMLGELSNITLGFWWLIPIIALEIIILKKTFSSELKKVVIYLLVCLGTVLTIYFTAKNPVWSYHFIAIDLLLTLFLSILISKTKIWPMVFAAFLIISWGLKFNTIITAPKDLVSANFANRNFGVKEAIKDSQGQPFSFVAYTWPLLRTLSLDYDYLFLLAGKKDKTVSDAPIIYYFVSSAEPKWGQGFIKEETEKNNDNYKVAWSKEIPGKTTMVKMVRN